MSKATCCIHTDVETVDFGTSALNQAGVVLQESLHVLQKVSRFTGADLKAEAGR
jgi:hypothetical protein